jgi:probable HAF family extracellular repeat protein
LRLEPLEVRDLLSAYQFFDLGTLGGKSSYAAGITDFNGPVVVGYAYPAQGNELACVFENGQVTSLGTLGGSSSQAAAITSTGEIVGNSHLTGDVGIHAFAYVNGQMMDLGTLGATARR